MVPFLIPLNILIPVGLVIIILIVVAWIILSKNKKLYQKITTEKQKFSKYKKRIELLQQSQFKNPKKDFKILNKTTRAFFKEYFNLSQSLTYLELEKYFKKKNQTNQAKFCRLMSDVNYKGNQTSPSQIKQLTEMLYKILNQSK